MKLPAPVAVGGGHQRHGGEPAVRRRAQPHALLGRRAVDGAVHHLLAGEGDLHRPARARARPARPAPGPRRTSPCRRSRRRCSGSAGARLVRASSGSRRASSGRTAPSGPRCGRCSWSPSHQAVVAQGSIWQWFCERRAPDRRRPSPARRRRRPRSRRSRRPARPAAGRPRRRWSWKITAWRLVLVGRASPGPRAAVAFSRVSATTTATCWPKKWTRSSSSAGSRRAA